MNMKLAILLHAGGPGSGRHPGYGTLQDAVDLATKAHKGQIDKSGFDYIDHPLRVMETVRPLGEAAMKAAVLHDVVEDTPVPLSEIEEKFGKEVADAVDAVSQRKGEQYFDYIKRVAKNPLGKAIKIADIDDNMSPARSYGRNLDALKKRYNKAMDILK